MSKKQKNVPKLRFPEFTGEWEERRLGDIATFVNGRAYSQEELLSSGKYKVLRVGNFYTNDSWYYSDMELDDKYYAVEGDLLYTWSATFGPHIWHGDKVIYHYHIWKVDLSEHLNKGFTVQLLEHDMTAITSDKNGSTMVHITKAGMEQKEVLIPSDTKEQEEIGLFLTNFDTLITLQQRKLDQIKEYKKGMLQKMLPKEGESVPEVRFPGFTGEWERKKLGDVTNEFRSGSFIAASNIFETGMYPVYGGNGLRGYADSFNHDGEFALIGRQGALCGNMNYSIGKAYFTEHAVAVEANEQSSTLFLYYLLGTMNLGQYSDQSAQPGLAVGKLVKLQNLFPTKEEQVKIAQFLNKLDTLITLHQRKLEAMKEYKKGLLQQLFV